MLQILHPKNQSTKQLKQQDNSQETIAEKLVKPDENSIHIKEINILLEKRQEILNKLRQVS